MSYLVFARKYRPQNFDEIIAQEPVTKGLKNAVASGKIAHAYIFSGPRGVGKTSCARILAKAVNCQNGPTINPCGKCPACVDITEGRSLDVIEIDGASNRGIDDIRNLRENVKFGASSARFKVYIIDEVHQITSDGFNALLKTLEEPPKHAIFIFATTAINKVPPTILSRCQKFEFKPISSIKIIEVLEQLAKRENLKVEKNVLSAIARASEGSLRDAESLLDQLGSFGKGEISLSDASLVLGLVEDDLLVSLAEKIIKNDAEGALGIAGNFINQGKDVLVFIVGLVEHFRNLMVAKVVARAALDKLLNTAPETKEEIIRQSGQISLSEILRIIDVLTGAQEMFKKIDSARIALEIIIVNMLGAEKENITKPQILPAGIKKTEQAPGFAKPVVSDERAEYAPSEAVITLSRVREVWQVTIDKIAKAKMSLATYLGEASPLKIEKNVLFVAFPKHLKFHKDVLEKRENSDFIAANLSRELGVNIRMNFVLSNESQKEETHEIEPHIKSTIAAFKGKIISGH